jgi:uncharacterized protein YjbI with pentapeptide repeats
MANEEHLAILRQGVEVWNKWREENPSIRPDITSAELSFSNLRAVNLAETDLTKAILFRSNLSDARLSRATMTGADLRKATLRGVSADAANLRAANLSLPISLQLTCKAHL